MVYIYEKNFVFFDRTYLDKTVSLKLNKGRKVSGVLRGYDQFMNIVLDEAIEELGPNQANNDIGMVVGDIFCNISLLFINSNDYHNIM